MAHLIDIVAYLCKRYPHKHELSKARLTKMVYLADWRSAINQGHQLTNLEWYYNHYGPHVDDITQIVRNKPEHFRVVETQNAFGEPKELIEMVEEYPYRLSQKEREILNHVIEQTAPMSWNRFIQLVYSTYPILSQQRYSKLNLASLSRKYINSQALLSAK